jgi:hypothetical protein
MSYTCSVEAAYNTDLEALQWLHSKGCPCNFSELLLCAAVAVTDAAAVPVLEWIRDTGESLDWTPAALSVTLNTAAACGCVEAAKASHSLLLHCKHTCCLS